MEPDANGWISAETPPANPGNYNVWFEADDELGYLAAATTAFWDGYSWTDGYRTDDYQEPTHWQPLPKPPVSP